MKIRQFGFAFIVLVLGSAFVSFGQVQTSTANKTQLEIFQEKYGSVIIKSYSQLAAITGLGGSVQISVEELRDPGTNTKVKGLLITIGSGDRYASAGNSFIEYAEIDSLIKGIAYISKIDKTVTTLNSFEAHYKTKGDFDVTVFNQKDGALKIDLTAGRIGSKSVFLDPAQLAEFGTQLQQAKSMLDAL